MWMHFFLLCWPQLLNQGCKSWYLIVISCDCFFLCNFIYISNIKREFSFFTLLRLMFCCRISELHFQIFAQTFVFIRVFLFFAWWAFFFFFSFYFNFVWPATDLLLQITKSLCTHAIFFFFHISMLFICASHFAFDIFDIRCL